MRRVSFGLLKKNHMYCCSSNSSITKTDPALEPRCINIAARPVLILGRGKARVPQRYAEMSRDCNTQSIPVIPADACKPRIRPRACHVCTRVKLGYGPDWVKRRHSTVINSPSPSSPEWGGDGESATYFIYIRAAGPLYAFSIPLSLIASTRNPVT